MNEPSIESRAMSCRLPLDLFAMIGEDAVSLDRSMNDVVRNIIKDYYENLGRKPNANSVIWMMNERNKNEEKRNQSRSGKQSFVKKLFGIQ